MGTTEESLPSRSPRWWQWVHVLSLEAPLVAVLWVVGLARLHDLRLLPGTLSGLALCVWTTYIIDRTIDTFGRPAADLDLRHAFYRRFRGLFIGGVIPAALVTLAWMAVMVIPAALMWQALALGLIVALYLAVYAVGKSGPARHILVYSGSLVALFVLRVMPVPEALKSLVSILILAAMTLLFARQVDRRVAVAVPKEVAGGILFALGCTMAIRFFGSEDNPIAVLLETLQLSALFTCNLTGITAKESEEAAVEAYAQRLYPIMLGLSAFLGGLSLTLTQLNYLPMRYWQLSVAVFAGLVLLAVVHSQRRRLSVDAYRAWVDLAVAVPVLWLLR